MAENPLKSENYNSSGGINTKISQYIAPATEYLNLQNVDFRKPGALTTFAGTANYNYSSTGDKVTGIADFYTYGITYGYGAATYSLIITGASRCFNVTGKTSILASGATPIYSNIAPNNDTPYSFVSANQVYSANQFDFFKYPRIGVTNQFQFITFYVFEGGVTSITGITSSVNPPPNIVDYTKSVQYSLPKPNFSPTFFTAGASTANGVTGLINIYASFVRRDGFIGPAVHMTAALNFSLAATIRMPVLNTFVGASYRNLTYDDFDILGTNMWADWPSQQANTVLFGSLDIPPFTTVFGISTATLSFSVTTGGLVPTQFITGYTGPQTDVLGTFIYGNDANNGSSFSPILAPSAPSTIDLYNNQMFFGGFYNDPDAVWYSDIETFELRNVENFLKVREKDGDIVTCIRAFFSQLLIFKQRSISVLTGDNPDNFALIEATDQFGAINAKCVITWNQKCWFLDVKGVGEYNGANTTIVSDKVDSIFKNMNVSAAKTKACMLHVKERDEIWIAIPTSGNTNCDTLVVYDIIAEAWTTRTLSNVSAISVGKENTKKQVPFQGDFVGQLKYFDDNIYAETLLGVTAVNGFTQVIKSRFVGDMGHSVEKQFRRLYTDIAVPSGATYNMKVNFYKNQGTSPALTMTFAMTEFQKRIDFGLSAKDLAVEWIFAGTSQLLFNGFTIEYRLQRFV